MKHQPRKRFGQNFLQDQAIIQRIIACINPQTGDNLLEIGPGYAALSAPLIEYLGHLKVVELDRDLIDWLHSKFSTKQLTIYSGDALKFDFSELGPELRVVGNLPYNISTPILFHLAEFSNIKNMTFMLQNEVVERICAKPSTKAYGKLSVMLQYKFKCVKLLDVPPESFYPQPKVDSAIISLTPRQDYPWQALDKLALARVVGAAFVKRRKTISNSLSDLLRPAQLEELSIDPSLRAENLSIDDFIKISQAIYPELPDPIHNK